MEPIIKGVPVEQRTEVAGRAAKEIVEAVLARVNCDGKPVQLSQQDVADGIATIKEVELFKPGELLILRTVEYFETEKCPAIVVLSQVAVPSLLNEVKTVYKFSIPCVVTTGSDLEAAGSCPMEVVYNDAQKRALIRAVTDWPTLLEYQLDRM